MDILYRLGSASVAEVLRELPDPPSYSAARALLAVLVNKDHVTYSTEGNRYIYRPKEAKKKAGSSAMKRVVNTFYGGSLASALAGLLESADTVLDPNELNRLKDLIRESDTESSARANRKTR